MKKMFTSKKGETYIQLAVFLLIFVAALILSINVLSFADTYVEMGRVSDELIQIATCNGGFTDEFSAADTRLKSQYFDYDLSFSADEYFNVAYKRVQLGDVMTLTVSKQCYLKGIGDIKIPVTLSVSRSGISEKYWK